MYACFDHVGALHELVERWHVPVYAHELEMPYLTGESDYPPADPAADHGLMVKMSPLLPRHGISMSGEHLIHGLEELAANFARTEIPKDSKYVERPEQDKKSRKTSPVPP